MAAAAPAVAPPVQAPTPSGLAIQTGGLNRMAAAQSQHANNTASVLGEMQKEAAANQVAIEAAGIERKQKTAEVQGQLKDNARRLAEAAPKDYWADRSTGAKIAAAIAIGMGAYASGMNGGPNQALAIIDSAIKRDMDLQMQKRSAIKDERGDIMNTYQMHMQEFNDANAARAATYGSMIEQAKLKIEQSAAKSKSAEVKAQAQIMIGQLTTQQEQAFATAAAKKVEANEKSMERLVPGMNNQFATTKEGAAKINELVADVGTAKSGINKLLALEKVSGSSLSPEMRKEAEIIAGMLKAALRPTILGTGAVSDGERKMLDDIVANPTNLFSMAPRDRIALKTLAAQLDVGLAERAKAYGLTGKQGSGKAIQEEAR